MVDIYIYAYMHTMLLGSSLISDPHAGGKPG